MPGAGEALALFSLLCECNEGREHPQTHFILSFLNDIFIIILW